MRILTCNCLSRIGRDFFEQRETGIEQTAGVVEVKTELNQSTLARARATGYEYIELRSIKRVVRGNTFFINTGTVDFRSATCTASLGGPQATSASASRTRSISFSQFATTSGPLSFIMPSSSDSSPFPAFFPSRRRM